MELKYKTLIFDFHGTVTDHQLRAIKAYHQAAHEAFGIHLGQEFYQQTLTRPSHSKGEPITNSDYINDQFSACYSDDQMDRFKTVHKEAMDKVYIPIPGMRSTIRQLIGLGVNVVLLTNGSNRESIIQTLVAWDKQNKHGVNNLRERLYSSHITKVRKPNPVAAEFILADLQNQGLNVEKSTTLIIGDNRVDSETASNAGIDFTLIVRGNGQETFSLREPKPTYLITDPVELLPIVEGNRDPETRDKVTIQPVLWKKIGWYGIIE